MPPHLVGGNEESSDITQDSNRSPKYEAEMLAISVTTNINLNIPQWTLLLNANQLKDVYLPILSR
jgi:hypothetical protein